MSRLPLLAFASCLVLTSSACAFPAMADIRWEGLGAQSGKDSQPVAQGFGEEVALESAILSIVPPSAKVSVDPIVNRSAIVTWYGGRPWPDVLRAALLPIGLQLVPGDGGVWRITPSQVPVPGTLPAAGQQVVAGQPSYGYGAAATPATWRPTQPAIQQSGQFGIAAPAPTPVASQTVAPAGNFVPPPPGGHTVAIDNAGAPPVINRFCIKKDQTLREVLLAWSRQENWQDPIVKGEDGFRFTGDACFTGDFQQIALEVLGHFRVHFERSQPALAARIFTKTRQIVIAPATDLIQETAAR